MYKLPNPEAYSVFSKKDRLEASWLEDCKTFTFADKYLSGQAVSSLPEEYRKTLSEIVFISTGI